MGHCKAFSISNSPAQLDERNHSFFHTFIKQSRSHYYVSLMDQMLWEYAGEFVTVSLLKDLTIKYEEKDMQIANHNKKIKAIWRLIHEYRVQREDPWIFIGNIKTNVTEKIII